MMLINNFLYQKKRYLDPWASTSNLLKYILSIIIEEKDNDKYKNNIFYLFIKFIDKLQLFLKKNNEAFNKIYDFHKKHNDNIKDIITTIDEFSKPSLKKNTEGNADEGNADEGNAEEELKEAKGKAEKQINEAKEAKGNAEKELKEAKGNAEKKLKEGKEKAERQAKDAQKQLEKLSPDNIGKDVQNQLEKLSPDNIGKDAQKQFENFFTKGGNDEEEEIMINIKKNDKKIIEELNYKYNEIFNYYKEIKNNINISSDFIKAIKIVIGKSGLNLADPIEKDEIRYEGLKVYFKRYNKDDKNKYIKELESLSDLFDNKWDDIIKDKQIDEINKEKIKQIKKDYKNITTFLRQNYLIKDIDEILEDKKDVSILNENVSLVSKIYYGKNNPIEKLKLIEKKVKNNDKLTEDEINFFKNFDIELNTIYEEKKNKLEGNENELKKLDDSYNKAIELYERLKNSDFAQKIEEIVNSGNFKKKNEIYWEDYIFIFRIFLTLFIYYCIITIIFILFISILGFLILIYDLIKNLIILFINKNNGYDINVNTLDYRFKKIINCTKDNFSNDRFLILNGQKQNIIIFNTCSYIMYLIIFYIMLYILVIIYSKTIEKQLVGNVDLLDPKFPFIILGIVFFIYSLIHLMFYKYDSYFQNMLLQQSQQMW